MFTAFKASAAFLIVLFATWFYHVVCMPINVF